jgi:hypothetical protein
MVKNLSMISDEVLSDFKKMPDNLTFAQAVEMLKTGPEKLARGTHFDQTTVAQKTPQ